MAELQMRKLRCQYDGTWKEIGHGLKVYEYIGGDDIDTEQDGEEVSILDVQDGVGKVVLIPPLVKWKWFWLNEGAKVEINNDKDFMYMWKYLKTDENGHSHLYFVLIENANEISQGTMDHFSLTQILQLSMDSVVPTQPIEATSKNAPTKKSVYNALVDEDEVIEGIRKVSQYNIDIIDADEVCVGEEENEKDYEDPDGYNVIEDDIVEENEVNNQGFSANIEYMEYDFSWEVDNEVPELHSPMPKPNDQEMELIAKCFNAERGEDEDNEVDGTILRVGQCFKDVYEARDILRMHAVKKRFHCVFKKNESHLLDGRCNNPSSPPCTWRCLVRRTNDGNTFRIRKINKKHTCKGIEGDKNPSIDARWIVSHLEVQMKLHHKSYSPYDIVNEMWHLFHLDLKYKQAWYARGIALEKVYGNCAGSYTKVPEMCRQILLTNPHSVAKFLTLDHFHTFTSICIAFKASLDGFVAGCRPLVGLDGCFLKGKYVGALLSMVALDGNKAFQLL